MRAPRSGLRIRRNEPRPRIAAFAGAALLLVCLAARAQPPSDTRSAAALDRERVAYLTANGVRAATSRAVVWVPPDTLSHDEAQALAQTLAGGVEAIDEFLHAPRPWQRPPGAVEYFFHPAMFISHANAVEGRVFISFPRIADGTAAFLHEATHALLFPSQSFLATYEGEEEEVPWLVEGLPTYVAKAVAEQTGFAEGNPFPIGSIEEIDATCARSLATPVGAEIAPFIGALGTPAGLSSRERRSEVAPAFYACAASFSKFLAEVIGIEGLVDLMVEPVVHPGIERRAGRSMDQLRAGWRERIDAAR